MKNSAWYENVFKFPVEIFWLDCLPKYIIKESYEKFLPKEFISKYIDPTLLDLVLNHLNDDFVDAFYKKFGKAPLVEYIKNVVDIKTNPAKYKGKLSEMVGDCLFCYLNIPNDAVLIDGYLYWTGSDIYEKDDDLKKLEVIDKYFINESPVFLVSEEKRIYENMDKAKKSYKALLRKIRKQNRQEIK